MSYLLFVWSPAGYTSGLAQALVLGLVAAEDAA